MFPFAYYIQGWPTEINTYVRYTASLFCLKTVKCLHTDIKRWHTVYTSNLRNRNNIENCVLGHYLIVNTCMGYYVFAILKCRIKIE